MRSCQARTSPAPRLRSAAGATLHPPPRRPSSESDPRLSPRRSAGCQASLSRVQSSAFFEDQNPCRPRSLARALTMLFLAGCATTTPAPRFSAVGPADAEAPEAGTPPPEPSLAIEAEMRDSEGAEAAPKPPAGHEGHSMPAPPVPRDEAYSCPMHPEVKQASPGSCPKCGMQLVQAQGQEAATVTRHVMALATATLLGGCASVTLGPLSTTSRGRSPSAPRSSRNGRARVRRPPSRSRPPRACWRHR